MRCIHSFLPSNLAGYKSNNSCSNTTHKVARKGRLGAESRFGTESINPLSKPEERNLAATHRNGSAKWFVLQQLFLLMHVQGNQNVPVCLEEKQCCAGTEQRKQLARKVPDPSAATRRVTHRGRLFTATACETVTGSSGAVLKAAGTFHGNSIEGTLCLCESQQGPSLVLKRACSQTNVSHHKASLRLRWCGWDARILS
jgi:hypothetical protein